MYSKQENYEKQLQQLGLMNDDAFTCACYLDQVGNLRTVIWQAWDVAMKL